MPAEIVGIYGQRRARIVVDVWGGEHHLDFIARFLRPLDEALFALVQSEVERGYLVNLRAEVSWGPEQEFDLRADAASPERPH